MKIIQIKVNKNERHIQHWAQHICYVSLTCFSTHNRHSYALQTCPSSHRLVASFILIRLHIGASVKNEKKLAQSFNFTFCYIDDVLSLNNSNLSNFVDRIYPTELEIKDTIEICLRHALKYA